MCLRRLYIMQYVAVELGVWNLHLTYQVTLIANETQTPVMFLIEVKKS